MPHRRGRPTPQQSLAVAKGPFIDTLVGAAATARDGLTRGAADERDRQVEDAFFRAAAALETFLSEWLVRCMSFDATTFRAFYETRAANWARRALDNSFEPSDVCGGAGARQSRSRSAFQSGRNTPWTRPAPCSARWTTTCRSATPKLSPGRLRTSCRSATHDAQRTWAGTLPASWTRRSRSGTSSPIGPTGQLHT